MTFHEEWFCEASQQALGDLYRLTEGVPGVVVEVGCWEGRSTLALAAACQPLHVRAVDTWQGSPGEVSAELAKERDVLATFMDNTAGRNIDVYVMGWRDYFDQYRDPIRFLHIDACHSYEEVRDNIAAALPLMQPGSVMCGDDVHHPPIQRAVLEQFPNAYRGRHVVVDPVLKEAPWLRRTSRLALTPPCRARPLTRSTSRGRSTRSVSSTAQA